MLDQLDHKDLAQLLQTCPVGALMLDSGGRVSWINDALVVLIGADAAAAVVGSNAMTIDAKLKSLLQPGGPFRVPDGQGGEHWLVSTGVPLDGGQGQVNYYVDVSVSHALVNERDQLLAQLEDLRPVDPTTGLANRRALLQVLEPQVSRSRRYNNPLSVVIMHLDAYQEYFEQRGEEEATRIIISIGHLLNDQMRWADMIGRLDEHEFLFILPETSHAAAEKLATKIHGMLQELEIEDSDEVLPVAASFGVAEWRKGDDTGMLMQRARETLNKNSDAA